MTNFILKNKSELQIFFAIWLCLSFILAPISFGLLLTPKIKLQEAKAVLSNVVFDGAEWVWNQIVSAYKSIEQWAIASYDKIIDKGWDYLKKALLIAVQVLIHQLLSRLTNSIIKWIQSDFHGKPGFITNWKDEMKGAANAAGGRFLNDLAGMNLCRTFKFRINAALLPVPVFRTQVSCTLDSILKNANATIEQFQKDFRSGGWVAFGASLQPNNNAFGAYLMAQSAKQALEFAEIQKQDKETRTGFKSTSKCLQTNTTGPASIQGDTSFCDPFIPVNSTAQCNANPDAVLKQACLDQLAIDTELWNDCMDELDEQGTTEVAPTPVDPSTVDPNSADCKSSIVTMPDGTVQLNTNLAGTSGIRSIEQALAGITTSLGEYGPYVTAIANALINQLVKDGVSGLLGAGPQPEIYVTPTYVTPETKGLFEDANAFSEISNDIAMIEQVKPNIDNIASGGLVNNAQQKYQNLLNVAQSTQNKQNDIINEHWARGVWTGATETITSGPTTSTTTTPPIVTITVTDYKITHGKVGEAEITKTSTTDLFGATTTVYALNSYKNQIQDIDGIVSSNQDKVDEYSNLITSAVSAQSFINSFKEAGNTYLVEYNKNPSSPATQAALDSAKQAREDAITALQSVTGSTTATLEGLNQELSTILLNASTDSATEPTKITDYQNYYNEVVAIYDALAGATP